MKARRLLFWLVAIANVVVMVLYIRSLEGNVVAIHYGIDGQADRFGSKWALTFLGGFPPLLLALYELYRKLTVKNQRIMANRHNEDRAVPMIAMAFVPLSWILATAHGETLGNTTVALLAVCLGVLMVFLSNRMGKISPNRTYGIKLPWTLKDDEVWRATHRISAYYGVCGGCIMVAAGLLSLRFGFICAISGIIVGVLAVVMLPTIYAYRMYHRIHG